MLLRLSPATRPPPHATLKAWRVAGSAERLAMVFTVETDTLPESIKEWCSKENHRAAKGGRFWVIANPVYVKHLAAIMQALASLSAPGYG